MRYLRDAIRMIASQHAIRLLLSSPVYETPALLPADAPAEWDIAFLNQVIAVETVLEPHALLDVLKAVEAHLGRQARGHWGPREIDCDLLLHGDAVVDSERLVVPHPRMHERRFVMQPLSDIAPDVAVYGKAASLWCSEMLHEKGLRRYGTAFPKLVGIVNVTPDSFSDGGKYAHADAALAHIEKLVADGADVIDIGAESTRPGAVPLSHEEEWARLEPVLRQLAAQEKRAWRLSIDSYHARTIAKAIPLGLDWANDVTGFTDARMLEAVRDSSVSLLVMHSLGVPVDPLRLLTPDIPASQSILSWASATVARLESSGILRERIILDPGLGFGKRPTQSLELMLDASVIHDAIQGVNWLYGHSRKSFMRLFGGDTPQSRESLTLAYSAMLAHAQIEYIRVHDIKAHRDLFDALEA